MFQHPTELRGQSAYVAQFDRDSPSVNLHLSFLQSSYIFTSIYDFASIYDVRSIYEELLSNFDNKLITCSLFLDLSKAFDCCDHEIFLDKLCHYGIRGVSHKLFSNFLHNRMQCTKIGAFKSSYKRISCGVPQGSVIPPLLFLIYINDITKASYFHTTLFPDDINLNMSNSSFNVLQTTVNHLFIHTSWTLNCVKLTTGWEPTSFLLTTIRLLLCY